MSNFSCVKISDNRISNCTDKLGVGVFSSAAEITQNKFKANTAGASNWNFNINIPSPNIIVDREVYIEATVNFTINVGPRAAAYNSGAGAAGGARIPAGQLAIDYGSTDALQAFPLNQLFTTCSATVNNSSTSVQTQSILQALLRSSSANNLMKYSGGCPALSDRLYLNYGNGTDAATTNVLADVKGVAFANEFIAPRGAFPITFTRIRHFTFNYGGNNAAAVDDSLVSANPQDSWIISLQAKLYEPLIGLAPFLWEGAGSKHNSMGIYGVNAMNFNMTIDSTLSRFWSSSAPAYPAGWSIVLGSTDVANNVLPPFAEVYMHMKFLTCQPSDAERLPLKNIVPYSNYTQYITTLPQAVANAQATASTITMSLSVIPDLIYIMVRIPQANMTPLLSSSFLTINSIVCTFNNKSGILSNYSSYDLWRLSVKNGLQDCSYIEWSGRANQLLVAANADSLANVTANATIPTCGSLCILSPSDFGLPDFLAPGVAGQYNMLFTITYTSNYAAAVNAECNVMVQESGLFITESGQSSVEIAILSKDDVLDMKSSAEHIPIDDYVEQVGGSVGNRSRSALKHFHTKKHEHHVHRSSEHGAGMSAGAMSAGSRHHSHKSRLSKYIA